MTWVLYDWVDDSPFVCKLRLGMRNGDNKIDMAAIIGALLCIDRQLIWPRYNHIKFCWAVQFPKAPWDSWLSPPYFSFMRWTGWEWVWVYWAWKTSIHSYIYILEIMSYNSICHFSHMYNCVLIYMRELEMFFSFLHITTLPRSQAGSMRIT